MPLPSSPHTRVNIRIQQIARYRVSGRLTDKQIGEIMGMSPAGLKYLINTPAYVDFEQSLFEGHISKMDMELAGNVEELRSHFRVAVPVAARTLLEVVQQKRDLRASLDAAKEILDRDPEHVFAKQSRNNPLAGDFVPGNSFNPDSLGVGSPVEGMLASMTADATKVTVQITATNTSCTSKEQQSRECPPIIGNSPEQLPLFGD